MANQAFADFFGTTPSRLIGKTASNIVGPNDAADFEQSERDVLAQDDIYEVERGLRRRGYDPIAPRSQEPA